MSHSYGPDTIHSKIEGVTLKLLTKITNIMFTNVFDLPFELCNKEYMLDALFLFLLCVIKIGPL